jgi:hypothetical protein
MSEENKKTSAEWAETCGYIICDPDGWDRNNYDYSFNIEKITIEEFYHRLMRSTFMWEKK